jgi:uncharacterized protein YkwD
MPEPGLRAALALLLGFGLVVSASAGTLETLAGSEAQAFDRINQVRRDHHLIQLKASPELARVARGHAEEMAREGYVSHVNTAGQNPLERARAAGVEGFRLLAENIGASDEGSDRLEAVVREWLRSPVHRENLLNPAFNTTGIAVVETPTGQTLYVQLFATY